MVDPSVPINQQNAFPTLTIAGATAPQQTVVTGGQVQKYFGPVDTGINAVAATTDAQGHIYVVTNFLDLSGCSNGGLVVARTTSIVNPNPVAVLAAFFVRFQYRLDKTTVMPTSNLLGVAPPTSLNLGFCGMIQLQAGGAGTVFAAMAGATPNAARTEYELLTWGPSATGGGAQISPVTIGSDVRIFLSFNTTTAAPANPPLVSDFFSVAIWGSS
jgi:hypothetical protein